MGTDPGSRDILTQSVIQCIINVHHILGPGFLENVYKRALVVELHKRLLSTAVETEVPVYYDGVEVGRHRLDLVVENRLILELKTVESLSKAHYAQVRSYLKATGYRLALLVNFADVSADFRRIELPLPHPPNPQ